MKYFKTVMPNGDEYFVPAIVIAESRARYYAEKDAKKENLSDEDKRRVFEDETAFAMDDPSEIHDWATNNMNWSEVEKVAKMRPRKALTRKEFSEGWGNGEHEVVDIEL